MHRLVQFSQSLDTSSSIPVGTNPSRKHVFTGGRPGKTPGSRPFLHVHFQANTEGFTIRHWKTLPQNNILSLLSDLHCTRFLPCFMNFTMPVNSPNQTTTPTNFTRGYWNTSFCCNPCIPKRVGPNQEPCRAKRLQQQGGLELRDLGVKSSVSGSANISWPSKVEMGREWLSHGKYIVCTCGNIGLRFL